MTKEQKRQIDKLLKKLEDEVLENGGDITSADFRKLKRIFLADKGINLEEYEAMEDGVSDLEKRVRKLEEERAEQTIPEGISQIKGEKGEKGDKGDKGDKGEQGNKGEKGEKGEKGDFIIGARGDKGEQGEPGKDGKNGKDGKDGKSVDERKIEKRISATLLGKMEIENKKMQEAIIEPVRRMGMGLQSEIDTKLSKMTPETPSGTINGSNKVFTITNSNLLALFLNGAFQTAGGVDYTQTGTTITYVNAPPTGSGHKAIIYT